MRHAITVSGDRQIIFNRSDGLRQNNYKTAPPPLLVLSTESISNNILLLFILYLMLIRTHTHTHTYLLFLQTFIFIRLK